MGDIFMLRGASTMYLYIYIGNDTFVNVGTGTKFAEIPAQARMQYAPHTTWKYHAVLRPSMVLDI